MGSIALVAQGVNATVRYAALVRRALLVLGRRIGGSRVGRSLIDFESVGDVLLLEIRKRTEAGEQSCSGMVELELHYATFGVSL